MVRPVVRKNTTSGLILSCTWPAARSQEDVLNALAKLPRFRYAVIGKEVYKQPLKGFTHHYHAHVVLSIKSHVHWALLDNAGGLRGYYQPVRSSPLEHLHYVLKEGTYLCRSVRGQERFMEDDILFARMPTEERQAAVDEMIAVSFRRQEENERVIALLRGNKKH